MALRTPASLLGLRPLFELGTSRRATQSKVSNPIFFKGAMRAARLSRSVACVMVQGEKKDALGKIALPDAHEYAK